MKKVSVVFSLCLMFGCGEDIAPPEGTFEGSVEKLGCPFTTSFSVTLFYDGDFLEGSRRAFYDDQAGFAFSSTLNVKGRFALDENDEFILEAFDPDSGTIQSTPEQFIYRDGQLSIYANCRDFDRVAALQKIR